MAKKNEANVNKLKHAFSIGADVTAACAYAEISREAFYTWCKKDEKLKKELDRLREKPVLKALNTVYKELDKADTARWYLERKRSNEFGKKLTLAHENAEEAEEKLGLLKEAIKKEKKDG